MQRGLNWKSAAKIVGGGLLIAAGVFFGFPANHPSTQQAYNVSIAHAQEGSGNSSTYCANWTADKLITIDTTNLPINTSQNNGIQSSTRDFFAIGPAEWNVTYKDGTIDTSGNCMGNVLATEKWVAPTPPACYSSAGQCGTTGTNAHKYLYGLVAPANSSGPSAPYVNMTFGIKNWNDSLLYSSTNSRFVGPGAVGQTDVPTNIEGYYASGAYGWVAGAFAGASEIGGRDYTEAAGIMMPLQWIVTGTLYAN